MKYIVILIDGMADYKIKQLGNKTPLQYAYTPIIDYLAKHGQIGRVKTIPDNMAPGSDIANLSVMGYDPIIYHTGRSSLEALSIGINLSPNDVTFRCNLVTLTEEDTYSERTMIDHSAGDISTDEAKILIEYIRKDLETNKIRLFPGVSYRHIVVWENGPYEAVLTPPHDILGKKIKKHLPSGISSNIILNMMIKSSQLLKAHLINKRRIEKGLRPANSIWIWGQGTKPNLDSFYHKYKLKGSVISAVDLIKGIGICAGLRSVKVKDATGNIHTNFKGKAAAAINELQNGQDFVYLHIEAPDECSHQGNIDDKVRAIEIIDHKVIKYIKEMLDKSGEDFKLLILPDHPTPISMRTHTAEPVPFLIYNSVSKTYNPQNSFDEDSAKRTSLYFEKGYKLMDYFLDTKNSQGKIY